MKHFVLSAILLLPQLLFGQPAAVQTGVIRGVVHSQTTMELLPLANVQVVGTSYGASTDENGKFQISGVPVGTYRVKASLLGFQQVTISDVIVATGKPAALVFELQPSTIAIEGVDVAGSYFRKSPDAAVSMQRLSFEEIRRSPGGFEDVIRAVAVLPGVAQASPGRNDLVVRGGAPSENLFVVNNYEIANINHFGTQGASGGPLSFINLDFVQETEFATGGFGVRYGDKLSSILNIDLREGRSDRVGGKATISASQFGLNLEGPAGQDATFLLSARRSYLDLIFKAAGFSFVPEYWDFLGMYSVAFDKSNRLRVLGVGAIDDVSFLNESADNRFDNSRVLGTAQRQYAATATWQHLFTSGYVDVSMGRTYVDYNGVQRDSFLVPVFSNKSREGEVGVKADVVMTMGEGSELSFGVQGKRGDQQYTLALPSYVTPFGDTLSVRVNDLRSTSYKAGSYGQWSLTPVDWLTFTAGVRHDYFGMIRTKNYLSPRGSLTFHVTDPTTLSVSAGVYRQSPSYVWLAANPANADLNAVRADQYVLSIEHLLQVDVLVRVEGYLKRYTRYPASTRRRYLVLANTGGGFGGADENFGSYGLDNLESGGTGRSAGVELLIQKKLSEIPLYGLLSLTFGSSVFTALDGVERPGTFDQRVIANLSGGYQFDERWEASMKFRFASGAPYTPFNANGTQNIVAYNSVRMKSRHSLDVRVDRRWNFTAWNLIAYVDIQNIYNNKFSGAVRWNAREQRVESDESALGILPSIGISAEF
jgi:hypothetical protein